MATNDISTYAALTGRVSLMVGLGCPDALIQQALRDAGRDLCLQGIAWEEDLDQINLVANTQDYAMAFDYDALIERILSVRYNGTLMVGNADYEFLDSSEATLRLARHNIPVTGTGITAYSAAATYSAGDKVSQSGRFYQALVNIGTPESFTITNWSPIDDGLKIRVQFRPALEGTTALPTIFYDRYATTLVNGAVMYLMYQAGTPWGDRKAARDWDMKFQEGLTSAAADALTRRNGGSPRMQTPRFF